MSTVSVHQQEDGDDHGDVVVHVEGELGPTSANALYDGLLARRPRHGARLLVNLAKVSACDPDGVNALLEVKHAMRRSGCGFALVAPSFPAAKALRVTGLGRNLEIYGDLRSIPPRSKSGLPRQRLGPDLGWSVRPGTHDQGVGT